MRRPCGQAVTPAVITYNEEANIERTLKALEWAENVIVLDSGSTDATERIARSFDNVAWRVRPFDTWGGQWGHAFRECGIRTRFTLALDADMVVTPEFVNELETVFLKGQYRSGVLPVTYVTRGRPLMGSIYPDQLRVFEPNVVIAGHEGHKHTFEAPEPCYRFQHGMLHDDRKPLDHWLRAQLKYAVAEDERIAAIPAPGLKDRLRHTGLVPWLVGALAYFRSGGPLRGEASKRYAMERMTFECLLALRIDERKRLKDGN
ncbi:MAG: glycosyltransferase [Bryobacteraceae bacterium]|nr:glycosyltransferase [Bryobacteraceae bacterium]